MWLSLKVRGDYGRAQIALQEAAGIFESAGDRSGAAWSLNQQGDIAREQHNLVLASELYQRALTVFRDVGDNWGTARSLADLGSIYCEQRDFPAGHAAYSEALEIFAELGHKRGMARVLEGAACLAAARGHGRRALSLAAAAARLRRVIGAQLTQAEQSKLESALRQAWESVGEEEGREAWERGAALSLERAIQYSMEEPAATTSSPRAR